MKIIRMEDLVSMTPDDWREQAKDWRAVKLGILVGVGIAAVLAGIGVERGSMWMAGLWGVASALLLILAVRASGEQERAECEAERPEVAGTYSYRVTYVTAAGESEAGVVRGREAGGGTMTEAKPCDYYDCEPDRESYSHTDFDEAIAEYLDGMLWPKMSAAEVLAALPNTVTVHGFRRLVLTPQDIGSPLNDVLERLDDSECGDPDGYYSEADTARMRAAESVFVQAIIADYVVWSCEEDESAREVVDVEPWVRAHCPEWLEVAK